MTKLNICNNKFNKVLLINLFQVIIQFVFFTCGIYFKSTSDIISTNILGMLTKIQTTNNFQNFIWCFTNNFAVLFIVFWLSYWTFGITGTLWCANSSFALGTMVKLSVIMNSWISVCFMLLEFLTSIIAITASTYFRFEKFKYKRFRKKNYVDIGDQKTKKEKREKNILITLSTIIFILLIAAILETITLNLM